jgi:AcrR family transcriptional regulator
MSTPQERKHTERQARRRRIQSAARGVFAEKGYAKTSIEQIARQASLSVGAIYLYFRSKEDLYVSLLEETMDSVLGELKNIRTGGDGTRLRIAWSYLAQWAAADVESTRILRLVCQPGVRKQLSDEVAKITASKLTAVRDELAAIIQDEIRQGTYGSGDPVVAADLLWALFLGLLQQVDARKNLDIEGPSLPEAAHSAFGALEATLKGSPARLQAA